MIDNLQLLREEVNLIQLSVVSLKLSLEKCKAIDFTQTVSFDVMDSIDALTSKFGRSSDIFTQKLIRTIFALEREPLKTFVDIMNRSEKLEIIVSAEDIIYIRDLRNQIAHEYIPEAIKDLVPDVLEYSVKLVENIEHTLKYIKNRYLI